MGQINLQSEYRNIEEPLVFRVRKLVIDSGGVVAEHVHQSRPGYAYILEEKSRNIAMTKMNLSYDAG